MIVSFVALVRKKIHCLTYSVFAFHIVCNGYECTGLVQVKRTGITTVA